MASSPEDFDAIVAGQFDDDKYLELAKKMNATTPIVESSDGQNINAGSSEVAIKDYPEAADDKSTRSLELIKPLVLPYVERGEQEQKSAFYLQAIQRCRENGIELTSTEAGPLFDSLLPEVRAEVKKRRERDVR